MSADAQMRQTIDDAVREATEPLRRAVDAVSARLTALEASREPEAEPAPKAPAAGRTAKSVKAGAAEATGEAKA